MRFLRSGATVLSAAALATGSVAVAPNATAQAETITIVGECSANRVSATDRFTLHPDGSYERVTRFQNDAGTRRRAALRSTLHPDILGRALFASYPTSTVRLGVGLFDSRTETLRVRRTPPDTIPRGWFPLLGSGVIRTSCAVDSNIPFDPRDFDSLGYTERTWGPQ
jgi:hypothetical protein